MLAPTIICRPRIRLPRHLRAVPFPTVRIVPFSFSVLHVPPLLAADIRTHSGGAPSC